MSSPLTIAYVANIRFPTEKAHGYQIARVCSALSSAGAKVTLIVPTRRNHITSSWATYYDVPENFTVVSVWCPDFMTGNAFLDRIAFLVQQCIFGILSIRKVPPGATVLTRDGMVAWLHSRRRKVVYIAHRAVKGRIHRILLARVSAIVANSAGTAEGIKNLKLNVPVEEIGNGSDPNPHLDRSKESLRSELNLALDKHIALYSGHLYSWKGADVLLDAADHLRENTDTQFVVIGGLPADVARYQSAAQARGISNIVFLGHQRKVDVPKYLRAADVLLLPNVREGESIQETSPLKLFEYFAAGRPIIASDLPSIRAIAPEETAFFVTPGDGAALALAIKYVFSRTEEAEHKAGSALVHAKNFTWERHAERLMKCIEQNS